MYGEPTAVTMAKKCSKCSGIREANEDRTDVPEMFRFVDISKFDFDIYECDMSKIKRLAYSFINEFEKWEADKKGLYFYSKTPGSGKTFLACCILKSVLTRTGRRCKFITAPDYMEKVSQSYKKEKGELDPTWIYRDCDLLVLDDIGTQMSKEWQQQELFRLVNDRLTSGKVTIFTSNNSVGTLNLEDRTLSRIQKTCIPIHVPEVSIRQQKANEEQMSFVKRILGEE